MFDIFSLHFLLKLRSQRGATSMLAYLRLKKERDIPNVLMKYWVTKPK